VEAYCDISRLMTFLANLTICAGLYAQCYKIFRTQSSKDINLALVVALMMGQVMALNYGLAIREWPIIAISCLNLPAVSLIAIGCWRYRQPRKHALQTALVLSRPA